jgi:hypothetical protein
VQFTSVTHKISLSTSHNTCCCFGIDSNLHIKKNIAYPENHKQQIIKLRGQNSEFSALTRLLHVRFVNWPLHVAYEDLCLEQAVSLDTTRTPDDNCL